MTLLTTLPDSESKEEIEMGRNGSAPMLKVVDENSNPVSRFASAVQTTFRKRNFHYYSIKSSWKILFFLTAIVLLGMYSFFPYFFEPANPCGVTPLAGSADSYVVNTPGCRIDKILPFDERYPEIRKNFFTEKPVECLAGKYNLTSADSNNILRFNQDVMKKYYPQLAECTQQSFYWDPRDASVQNDVFWGEKQPLNIDGENEIKDEFVFVNCLDQNKKSVYARVHFRLRKITKNIEGYDLLDATKDTSDRLNVMGVGIESTSRLVFLRHCPEIDKYIREQLGGVTLEGFNKVGDNTITNMYPLGSGRDLMRDWKSLLFSTVDSMDLIWRDFGKAGYVTVAAEEIAGLVFPTYFRILKRQPMDHFARALRLVTCLIKQKELARDVESENKVCFGRDEMEYTLQHVKLYKDSHHFFSLTFVSNSTHGALNDISRSKHMIFNFLQQLEESGVLNKTIVFLFGDHGFRSGGTYFKTTVGAYEARLPVMYVIPPKWFPKKYPEAFQSLKINANRLTTFLDMHQTLHDIVQNEFPRKDEQRTVDQYGTSLFRPIPITRTCQDAGIRSHWCACGCYRDVPISENLSQRAAKVLFNALNEYNKINLTENQCVTYTDYTLVKSVVRVLSSDEPKSNERTVTIRVQPYNALFRAAVPETGIWSLSIVERLDKYSLQAACLNYNTLILELTCICKNWNAANDPAWQDQGREQEIG